MDLSRPVFAGLDDVPYRRTERLKDARDLRSGVPVRPPRTVVTWFDTRSPVVRPEGEVRVELQCGYGETLGGRPIVLIQPTLETVDGVGRIELLSLATDTEGSTFEWPSHLVAVASPDGRISRMEYFDHAEGAAADARFPRAVSAAERVDPRG